MRNIIGKPVTGADFFGRERELLDLKRISESEHVLLLAPRRVGKTSLLSALASEVERDGSATGVYASVAGAKSEATFLKMILGAIYSTKPGTRLKLNVIATWVGKHARRVRGIKIAGSGVDVEGSPSDWQDDANRAFAQIVRAERPWLILVDELPILVLSLARQDPSGERVRGFLQWFRDLRQRVETSDKLRFVLAGSVGLDSVTRRHQLTDTINDLRDWRLGPYDGATADRFLIELARSHKMNVEADLRRRICEQAEWLIPYHLQVIFSALREKGALSPSRQQLDAAIEELLGRKIYFSSWEERLRGALGIPEDAHARAVLRTCAADPKGALLSAIRLSLATDVPSVGERERIVRWLLDVLANDGYLVEHAGRWRFRSGLLRRYWQRHVI